MTRKHKKPRTWHYVGQQFSIKPSYVVSKAVYECSEVIEKHRNPSTDKNLLDNSHGGEISEQSAKKIRTAIDWLCASAKDKYVEATDTTPAFRFKVNFITLTLPGKCSHIDHINFYNELLHPFLDYARKYLFLNNYVWKMELQSNGNPHIHLTTDTFIHWKKLRSCWNRILKRKGCLEGYAAKHSKMSFEDYVKEYPPTELVDVVKMYERWQYGKQTNWEDPNTTDVHATKNINNLAGYLCKYMAKNMSEVVQEKGLSCMAVATGNFRIWSCNRQLSAMFVTTEFIASNEVTQADTTYMADSIKYKTIFAPPDSFGESKKICEIFFIRQHQWGSVVKGRLYKKYCSVKEQLQTSWQKDIKFKPFSNN